MVSLGLWAIFVGCNGPSINVPFLPPDTGFRPDTGGNPLEEFPETCVQTTVSTPLDDISFGFTGRDALHQFTTPGLDRVVWAVRSGGLARERLAITCDETPTALEIVTRANLDPNQGPGCPRGPELVVHVDCTLDIANGGFHGSAGLELHGDALTTLNMTFFVPDLVTSDARIEAAIHTGNYMGGLSAYIAGPIHEPTVSIVALADPGDLDSAMGIPWQGVGQLAE